MLSDLGMDNNICGFNEEGLFELIEFIPIFIINYGYKNIIRSSS